MGQFNINTFSKGMIQDLGKTLPQDGSYIEGRNLRIIANEDPDESGIIVNVKGNSFALKFMVPASELSPCQLAWINKGSLNFSNNMQTEIDDFFAYEGLIYYNYNLNGILNEGDIDRNCVLCGEPANDSVGYLLGYGGSSVQSNQVPTEEEIASIGSEYNSTVIGWASIRDSVYVFTTINESFNPGGVFLEAPATESSYGYIFEVTFNLKTNASSSNLIYSHPQLNFTTQHPIESLGRYETDNIQRLYWTDNFNTVRTINVKALNLSELSPDDLSINPSITFSKPKIESVSNGGSLPSGMYQYAYRLRNSVGAETRFSPLSGLIHIVKASEGESYWEYSEDPENITEYVGNAPGEICEKAVTLQLNNIDTDYDFIEIAAIYRTTKEGSSNSYIFSRKKIVSNSIKVTHSSNIDIVSLISLVELTSFNVNIHRAKTLATKDNRLFIGNVITPLDNIKFNARAYRYKRLDEEIYVGNVVETETYVDPSFDINSYDAEDYSAQDLDKNINAINPYNELVDGVVNREKSYKYQSDGRTLGGEGPFVSYEFIKKELDGDNFVSGAPPQSPPFVEVKPSSADCTTGESYYDYKNPITNSEFKGYQRDEVYRFGLIFYDSQGNPGSVNWIGDIRFPRHKDFDYKGGASLYNYTLSQTRSSSGGGFNMPYHYTGSHSGATLGMDQDGITFLQEGNLVDLGGEIDPDVPEDWGALSSLGATAGKDESIDKHSMYALGIKFKVNIPNEIKKLISGYSIVRVERKDFDKTVLGMGMGNWLYRFGEKNNLPETYRAGYNASGATWGNGNPTSHRGELRHNLMTIDSPDFLLTGKYPTAADCDWVEVIGELGTGRSANSYENDFVKNDDDNFYRKYYSHAVVYRDAGVNASKNNYNDTFFKPEESSRLDSNGYLPATYIGGSSDTYFPRGIINKGFHVNNGGSDVDAYSTGAETFFVRFPAYHTGGDPDADYYVGDVPQSEVKTSFPYWEHWLLSTGDTSYFPGQGSAQESMPNQIYFHSNSDGDVFSGGSQSDATLSYNDSDGGHVNQYEKFKVQEKPLLSWRRERPNQYGGNDNDSRSSNVYIQASDFVPVVKISEGIYKDDAEIDVWGGDTYIHFYDMVKFKKWQTEDGGYNGGSPVKRFNINYAFPVESSLNLALREGFHFANKNNFDGKTEDELQWDNTIVRNLYSAENDLLEFYPKSIEFELTGQFDNRVLYSDEKVNGDATDSWTAYKINNYRDLDGKYGPINKLILFRDTLISLQDRGVASFSINPVAITTSQDAASIVLGTGKVIQDHKYIVTDIGTKHQWSVLATNKGLYWVDILTNSIYKIGVGKQGLLEMSRVKGLKNYFENLLEKSNFPLTRYDNLKGSYKEHGDNPIYDSGIVTGYDAKNNEVLFSFIQRAGRKLQTVEGETICFSETTQTFTSFYDFVTNMFINTQDKLLSVNPNNPNHLYLHNSGNYGEFYEVTNNTTVEFIINKFPIETKVFDNFEWHTEVLDSLGTNIDDQTWSIVRFKNDYQENSFALQNEDNIKRRERTWKVPILRSKDTPTRLRDKYLIVTLVYVNSEDRGNKIRAHYVKTKFRVSKR